MAPTVERQQIAAVGWAAAACLLLFAGWSWYSARQFRRDKIQLEARLLDLEQDAGRLQRALAIVMSRDSRLIPLRQTAATDAAEFRAFWSEPGGILLAGINIPKPSEGRTWQLWILPKKGNPVSGGVIEVEPGGRVLVIASTPGATFAETSALAVSEEPAGGSPQPTAAPAWLGPLSD